MTPEESAPQTPDSTTPSTAGPPPVDPPPSVDGTEESAPPSAESPPRVRAWIFVLVGCGGLLAIPVLALVALGIAGELGITPGSAAVPGDAVDHRIRPMLEEEGILEPDEPIIYFYSTGLLSYREDGNYFTDRRVVSYYELDGEFIIEEAAYSDVVSIEPEWGAHILDDSWITITLVDEEEFYLLVSCEGRGDRTFHRLLKEQWQSARGESETLGTGGESTNSDDTSSDDTGTTDGE